VRIIEHSSILKKEDQAEVHGAISTFGLFFSPLFERAQIGTCVESFKI